MTEIVKLENNLCRCCHSEGSYKSLAEPCTGSCLYKPEIFADMLKNYLDITLSPVAGELCVPTYTICDLCIMKLCNAVTFKKQVLQCEEKFIMLYTSNIMKVEDPKIPEVKVELTEIDEEKNEESSVCDDTRPDDLSACDDRIQDEDFPSIDDDAEFQLQCDLAAIQANEEKKAQSRTRRNQEAEKPMKNKKKPAKKGRPVKKKEPVTEVLSDGEETKKQEIEKQKKMLEEEKKKGKQSQQSPRDYYTITYQDGAKNYKCKMCERAFKSVTSVVQHYRGVHLKVTPKLRSCYFCEVKVPGYMRAAHMESAHGVPAPSCGACGKKFGFPFQVLRHQKIFHMGEKTFTCDQCDMQFSRQHLLREHAVKHSGMRMHRCQYCEKAFKWKKNLRTHIMMHLDDRRHVCSVCKEAFVQHSSLKYHMTKKHPHI